MWGSRGVEKAPKKKRGASGAPVQKMCLLGGSSAFASFQSPATGTWTRARPFFCRLVGALLEEGSPLPTTRVHI